MRTSVLLARGAMKRCGRCGCGGLFHRYFSMVEQCPRCGLLFEREEGYWTGAMMVNIAITELVFLVLFVGLTVAWWPDPPWTRILVIVVVVNLTLPIVLYPFSKTLWVAGDLAFRAAAGEAD